MPQFITFVKVHSTGYLTSISSEAIIDSNVAVATLENSIGYAQIGWLLDSDTWIYVSATSFKVEGKDVRTKFPKGTKLKLTNSTVKYFYVVSTAFSTDTTVTVTGGSDYALVNAAITANYYSYASTPQEFPGWFNWNGVVLSQGASSNISKTVRLSKFVIDGEKLLWRFIVESTGTGSAGSSIQLSMPVTPLVTFFDMVGFGLYDDSSTATYIGNFYINSNKLALAAASVTTRGASVGANPSLEIASGDRFDGQVCYEI